MLSLKIVLCRLNYTMKKFGKTEFYYRYFGETGTRFSRA
jgi:hypothetical protein